MAAGQTKVVPFDVEAEVDDATPPRKDVLAANSPRQGVAAGPRLEQGDEEICALLRNRQMTRSPTNKVAGCHPRFLGSNRLRRLLAS